MNRHKSFPLTFLPLDIIFKSVHIFSHAKRTFIYRWRVPHMLSMIKTFVCSEQRARRVDDITNQCKNNCKMKIYLPPCFFRWEAMLLSNKLEWLFFHLPLCSVRSFIQKQIFGDKFWWLTEVLLKTIVFPQFCSQPLQSFVCVGVHFSSILFCTLLFLAPPLSHSRRNFEKWCLMQIGMPNNAYLMRCLGINSKMWGSKWHKTRTIRILLRCGWRKLSMFFSSG